MPRRHSLLQSYVNTPFFSFFFFLIFRRQANSIVPEYGECGIGSYCVAGCNPQWSYDLDSCAPVPICQNQSWTFTGMDDVTVSNEYLGDSDSYGFTYSGYPAVSDDMLFITMPNQTSGTVLASTKYIWYGNVKVTMKSSRGRGVVTAFMYVLKFIKFFWSVFFNFSCKILIFFL